MAADVITPTCPSRTGPPVSPRASIRPLVYITRCIPQTGLETLLGVCNVKHWDSELPVPRGEMLNSVRNVHAILCLPSDCVDVEVLDAAGPSLRVIATLSRDSEHIDTAECVRRGVTVLTVPGPVKGRAQLTLALMLLTIKHCLTETDKLPSLTLPMPDLLQSAPDSPSNRCNRRPRMLRKQSQEDLAFQLSNGRPINPHCDTWLNIAKKTIGVFGINELGLSVIRTLNSFGFKMVLATNLEVGMDNCDIVNKSDMDFDIVDFDEFLARSEVICVCSTSDNNSNARSPQRRRRNYSFSSSDTDTDNDDTHTVFNKETFQKMQRNAILITSQSEESSVDYMDLHEALRDGHIQAAGLNDCNQEPVPFKIPLSGLGNCVFLPQSSESEYDARHEMASLITHSLIDELVKTGTRTRMDSISESE